VRHPVRSNTPQLLHRSFIGGAISGVTAATLRGTGAEDDRVGSAAEDRLGNAVIAS
jgi:hypothetical protein